MKIKYENTLCCYCRHWAFVCVGLSGQSAPSRSGKRTSHSAWHSQKWNSDSVTLMEILCIGKLSPATVRKPGNKTKDSLGHFVCGDKKGLPKLLLKWPMQQRRSKKSCAKDDFWNHESWIPTAPTSMPEGIPEIPELSETCWNRSCQLITHIIFIRQIIFHERIIIL